MSTFPTIQLTERGGLARRYAQIAIPGVTEPKVITGITIPQAPVQIPIPPPNKQDKKNIQAIRARARQREQLLLPNEIESVEFNLFSTEEIDIYAVVNVSDTDSHGPGTVRDTLMGPHNDIDPCDTCGGDMRSCPGHYGKLILPRLMHPLAVKAIIDVLTCVCNSCASLLVTKEELRAEGIDRMSGMRRLQAIKALVARLSRQCKKHANNPNVEPCKAQPKYSSYRDIKDDYKLTYTYKGDKEKHPRKPTQPETNDGIYEILNSISNEDAQLLGFSETHPRDMIMERLIVIPYCARPDLSIGDKHVADHLTVMYIDILSKLLQWKNENVSESKKEEHLTSLYWKILHFMKNDGRYGQNSNTVYTDLRKRIQGKTAIVRANIMGKRVNFAGRTVVGPAAYLRVDQVGIPRLMTNKLTRPITVTAYTRDELQAKYDAGRVRHITPRSGKMAGIRVMVNETFREKHPEYQKLQLGDVVERCLENGDVVIVNRQPSLHKQSMLALKAVIIDDRIIRINMSITTPLNADFDGDEINVHVPQTIEAYAEAEQLLGIYQNLMNAQTNKPMMGIVYDSLSGAYLLTRSQDEFEKLQKETAKMNQDITKLQRGTKEYEILHKGLTQKLIRLRTVQERIQLDPVVFNQAIIYVADAPQFVTLRDRLNRYGVEWGSGRALFSATLPEEFDYDARGVVIKNGILIHGTLSKDTLGDKDGSIISELFKQLGGLITVDFMSDLQFVLREYLEQTGFSIGIDDCIPDDPEFRKIIDEAVGNATLKVISLTGESSSKIMADQQERKIDAALKSVKNKSDTLVQERFKPDNALLIMANGGAKGSPFNATQIASLLGQQKVSGKRIPANLPGNRSLPVFQPNDPDPRARGFCYNSFSSGLEPSEMFFHAQGGRENLVDVSTGTAQTGFLQHQMIKSAEDIHISADGSVRTADNAIVQFVFGDDGLDSAHLTSVKLKGESVPFFRNIQQLAHKINRKYA